MDLDRQYAEACYPPRWRICGVLLQPFSLGHALLLDRVGSPLLWGEVARAIVADLIQGLWICSQAYPDAAANLLRPMSRRWRLALWWIAWTFRNRHMLALTKLAMFREYVNEAMRRPPVERDGEMSKPSSTPGILCIKRALMIDYGYSAEEALSLPYGQAQWEYYGYLEREGAVTFLDEEKQAEREEARRRNEKFRAHPELIDAMIREVEEAEAKRATEGANGKQV
jgi:hypothetical protein